MTTEHQALRPELSSVEPALMASTDTAESLPQEAQAQAKERVLLDLENDNQWQKAQLDRIFEDLVAQKQEVSHRYEELERLHLSMGDRDRTPQHHSDDGHSLRVLQDLETESQNKVSLSVPEMETSERIPVESDACLDLDLPRVEPSPQELIQPPRSRTISPDSTLDNFTWDKMGPDHSSVMDSPEAEKQYVEEHDSATSSSSLGCTFAESAAEWASDGYGSKVRSEGLEALFEENLPSGGMNPPNTVGAAGSTSYSGDLLPPQPQKVFEESRADDSWDGEQSEPVESQLRAELREREEHLRNTCEALQEQENTILSLRETVEDCEEALRRKHVEVEELHQELEQERALNLQKDRELKERREFEHESFAELNAEVISLNAQLKHEKDICRNLIQDLQNEQLRNALLEKSLADAQEEREKIGLQQELSLQDKTLLERFLKESDSSVADVLSKRSDARISLHQERERWSKQLAELSHKHEARAATDRRFMSDLCSQLENEQRWGKELKVVTDKLGAQLLQDHEKREEEERIRRTELQREQEAATQQRVAMETLKEQNREVGHSLELERELTKIQGVELEELKNQLRLTKEKTNSKLFLRKQNQEQLQELQRRTLTLNELTGNGKVLRLYERYLRAESFRTALLFQKRYLLLLLGSFNHGEQGTLRFIACLGPLPVSHPSSWHRPMERFRAVVHVVVAVLRMKFLARKWQEIRGLSPGVANGHAPGLPRVDGPRPNDFRQQLSSDDQSMQSGSTLSPLVSPSKSPLSLQRFGASCDSLGLQDSCLGGTSRNQEQSLTQYILQFEEVQQ